MKNVLLSEKKTQNKCGNSTWMIRKNEKRKEKKRKKFTEIKR